MTKICISFKQTELELLEHLRTKRSASNYVKDLIENDMKNNNKPIKSKKEEVKKSNNDDYSW